MKMPKFDYVAPASLDEATRILAANEGSKVLSGGQSLLPILAFRLNYPSLLVDLKNIRGLSEIAIGDDGLRIGSRVRWCQIEGDDRLRKENPLLVSMISCVAHYQIRHRGTVGGSLAHGDPAAEMPGFAVTSDCVLSVIGSNGAREINAGDFYTGALESVLESDEIIASIFVPKWRAGRRWGFQEFSHRKGDFAIAGVAVFYDLNSGGEVENAHVGLIGAADTPIRLGAAEDLMNGRPLTSDLIATIRDRARDAVDPIADTQISADYRRSLVGTLLSRVLLETLGQ